MITLGDYIPLSGAAAALGVLVLWVVSLLAAVWVDRTVTGREEPETDSTRVEGTMADGDLPEADPADLLELFDAPDSTEVVTRCNTIPRFLARPSSRRPTSPPGSGKRPPSGRDASSTDQSSSTSPGLGYDIIPTRDGRPTVSVGPTQVVFPTYDPVTGQGERRTIEIPTPSNEVAAVAEAGLLPTTPIVMAAGEYTRDHGTTTIWGTELDVSTRWRGGYATTRYGHGPMGTVGVSISINW